MKLYITTASPYSRMARIMLIEKRLERRVEVNPAQTRVADSPFYAINPSGRVPYLICEDGIGLEESALICDYFDTLDGAPLLARPAPLQALSVGRLEARARSLIDGLAVWFRETARPAGEGSPTVILHERARSERLLDWWEETILDPWMQGPLNLAQLTLGCALGFEPRLPGWNWRKGRPSLAHWYERVASRPSFAATVPPPFVSGH